MIERIEKQRRRVRLVRSAPMATRYIVRDIATKGVDFLLWVDDNPELAKAILESALADGLAVELVTMPADAMDRHTRRLIEGA